MNIEDSIKILKEFNKIKINSYAMQFVNISYPDLQEAIETLLTAYEKQKDKIKKAIDFINVENNFFEDGENWQNALKIKEILEEEN